MILLQLDDTFIPLKTIKYWKRLEHLDNTVYHVYFVDGKTEEFTAMDHHLINVKLRR